LPKTEYTTLHRRRFVQSIAWGAAGIAATSSLPAGHDAAIREPADTSALADHRIAKVEARQVADRYPRFVGRNSFGTPQGWGGTRQLRVVTTDRGARAWGLARGGDERFRALPRRPARAEGRLKVIAADQTRIELRGSTMRGKSFQR
jgi:hypothetical protein